MDHSKILLIKLSPQYEEASKLIGAVIIGKILMTAFSRSDIPDEDKRRDFSLYCDEFHRFASSDFATLISEARKFRIATCISHQTLTQLTEQNRASALACGNIICFRVSGDDAHVISRSFDTTPQHQIIINGEEPIRAPAADPLGHLVKHGSRNTVIARFVAEYLMPLDALIRKVGHVTHPFQLGCAFMNSYQVIEGHKRLNDAFATCMREGRPDVTLDPLALFVLGGAVDAEITDVFCNDLRYEMFGTIEMKGFYGDSYRFGRAGFLTNQKQLDYLIKQHDSDGGLFSRPRYPAAKFIRMLTALRETLAILSREPLMVETGTYRPRLQTQIQTFQDRENQIARDLANAPNYTCKVRLVSGGEYVIRTKPPQETLTGDALTQQIARIKAHMRTLGVIRHYTEVERELSARHQRLLGIRDTAQPPTTNGSVWSDGASGTEAPEDIDEPFSFE